MTTFKEIEKIEPKILKLKNKKGGAAGFIRFNHLRMDVRPSLVEYLRHGWKMDVSIAIDFSLSNLEINDYQSLHKLILPINPCIHIAGCLGDLIT